MRGEARRGRNERGGGPGPVRAAAKRVSKPREEAIDGEPREEEPREEAIDGEPGLRREGGTRVAGVGLVGGYVGAVRERGPMFTT